MENFSDKQNEAFGRVFNALKGKRNPIYKSDALTLLKLNDENFGKSFKDSAELTGDQEDIDLCMQRAKHLGI